MTLFEALTWANNFLKKQTPTDSPMLDAQLLLSHVLNVSKTYLFTHFHQELTTAELERFENLISRRGQHEPIAYILGEKEFYGRYFLVNPFVLIPRPETEIMITEALNYGHGDDLLFLDVGTGSGAIAVTLAVETNCPVLASDCSRRALSVAVHNARRHRVEDRLQFFEGDLIEPFSRTMIKPVHHLVVCANLPYLSTAQWQRTPPDVKNFEPKEALDGGVDGLAVYDHLCQNLRERKKDFPQVTSLLIEIDPAQAAAASYLINKYFPKAPLKIIEDLSGRPRLIAAQLRSKSDPD